MNDLGQLRSPDTGTSSYTYDAAGNRITQTDARAVVTTYAYDALNRLTTIHYPTGTLGVHYYYDEAKTITGCPVSCPKGRLTRMTDVSGSTAYCYDKYGNIASKIQVLAGNTYTTVYIWNTVDRLMGVTYPDGASVTYTRDGDGRISKVNAKPVAGANTPVITAISYLPFGPASAYTFALGSQKLTRSFNLNYLETQASSNALYLQWGLDALGRSVWLKTASTQITPVERYVYDPLSRLSQVKDPNTTL